MGEVLPRRFYSILSRRMYLLIGYILALFYCLGLEAETKDFKRHPELSYTFFVLTLPLYFLVLFGCYTLVMIGYHMIILQDCKEAQDELLDEIKNARTFLTSKGMKF